MQIIFFFVRNIVFTIVSFLVALMLGVLSIIEMKVIEQPRVPQGILTVDCSYTDTVEGVEKSVTNVLESGLFEVAKVERITSKTTPTGSSIRINYVANDPHDNTEAVLSAFVIISKVQSKLPRVCRWPVIRTGDMSSEPVITVAFTSSQGTEYMKDKLTPIYNELSTFTNLRSTGFDSDQSIYLELDPNKMRLSNVSFRDVENLIGGADLRIASAPIARGFEQFSTLVTIDTSSGDLKFDDCTGFNLHGNRFKISDIGKVIRTQKTDVYYDLDGRECIIFDCFPKGDASVLDVSKSVNAYLNSVEVKLKANQIETKILTDSGKYVQDGIKGVVKALVEASILVVIVIVLFLRSFKLSFPAIVSLVFSIVPSFIIFKFLNLTINIYTLFGCTVASGVVVDDGTIVTENFESGAKSYSDPKRAASDLTGNIMFVIIAMTIIFAVVYVPVLFSSDPNLQKFKEYAIVIITTVLCSGVVSVFLVPMMLGNMFSLSEISRFSGHDEDNNSFFYASFARIIDFLLNQSKIVVFGVVPAIIAATYSLFINIDKQHDIVSSQGVITYQVHSLSSTPHADFTHNQLIKVYKALSSNEDFQKNVDHVLSVATDANNANHISRLIVTLKPYAQRTLDVQNVRDLVEDITANMPLDIKLLDISTNKGSSLNQYDFIITQTGRASLDDLLVQVRGIQMKIAKEIPGCDLHFERMYKSPQFTILIDRTKALKLDQQLIRGMLLALQPYIEHTSLVEKIDGKVRNSRLHIKLAENSFDGDFSGASLRSLMSLPIWMKDDEMTGRAQRDRDEQANYIMTCLQSVSRIKEEKEHMAIYHNNGCRSLRNTLLTPKNISFDDVARVVENVNRTLPPDLSVSMALEDIKKQQSYKQALYMIIFAIVLTYLVLAAFFESFLMPLIIISVAPFAAFGALAFMKATNEPLSTISMLGILTLMGMIFKHSVIMCDAANKELEKLEPDLVYYDYIKKCIRYAVIRRFRPIVMTAVAMTLGVVPLLRDKAEFSEYKIPIAKSIIGGMVVGTILTVLLTPCIYLVLVGAYYSTYEKKKEENIEFAAMLEKV